MLVLSREVNEIIDVFVGGEHIEVCLVDVRFGKDRRHKSRIGINANEETVRIHRREIALKFPELAARIKASEEAKRESA